tara:strand:+ start:4499 stop:5011 length:513 start_codon:yes stop_codon:yes gene_type:complete
MSSDNLVIIGRIGKTYGIKGWVKVHSFTQPTSNLLTYSPWQFKLNDQWQDWELEDTKPHGDGFIAKLRGFNNPEDAKRIVNADIAINREQLPAAKDDEIYWHDLTGLTVITKDGDTLGTITELLESGAHDLIVVKGDKEYLIPYVLERFVLQVDTDKQHMTVDWDKDFTA